MSDERAEDREEISAIKDMVELFHAHDLHLPTRTIYIGSMVYDDGDEGGTDAAMAEGAIKNLHVLESLSMDPITIVANNPGGDAYHGLAIYDAIRCSPCAVTIKARGHAMSMGSIIMQAANERLMSPTAMQLLHYGTDCYFGHAKDFEKRAEEGKRFNRWMEEMYLERIHQKRPDVTLEQLREMIRFDAFLTAQQSIDLGLADGIG